MLLQNPSDLPSVNHVLPFIQVHDGISNELCCEDFSSEMMKSFLHKSNSEVPQACSHELFLFSSFESLFNSHNIVRDETVELLRPYAELLPNLLRLDFLHISQVENFPQVSKEVSRFLSTWTCY